jgi:hypothetical protein
MLPPIQCQCTLNIPVGGVYAEDGINAFDVLPVLCFEDGDDLK